MAAPLGNVIYWFACAVGWTAVRLFTIDPESPSAPMGYLYVINQAVGGVLAWVAVRAGQYVLAGR